MKVCRKPAKSKIVNNLDCDDSLIASVEVNSILSKFEQER
jgi:hypothetical protein